MPEPRQPFTIPLAQSPVAPSTDRLLALLFAGTAVFAVAVLLPLQPDARGFDTHVQLGLDSCSWPSTYGLPCPACGCTTAASLVVRGRWLAAVATQPFGAVLALGGLALGVHATFCLVRARSFVDLLVRLPFWRILMGAIVLLLAAWGYKCAVWPT